MKNGMHSALDIARKFAGVTFKEARRLITSGQLKVHGIRVKDPELFCEIKKNTEVEIGLLQWTVVY